MHCHVLITDKFQHITNRTKVIDSRRIMHGRVMKELSLKQKASIPPFVIGSTQQEENKNNNGNSFQIDALLSNSPNKSKNIKEINNKLNK